MGKPLLLERMVLEFNTFSEEKYSVGKHCLQPEAGKSQDSDRDLI